MSAAKVATALPSDTVKITTDLVTEPFWQAAKERRLVVPRCGDCGTFRLPPTPFCPECQSTSVEWPEMSGRATVYSFAVVHGFPGVPDVTLVPAVVELPDAPGVRVVTNVVGVEPEEVRIGMELNVDFHPIADGWLLPVFRSASETGNG
jgi:uncharacterized OB-fold protein